MQENSFCEEQELYFLMPTIYATPMLQMDTTQRAGSHD